MNKFIFHIDVYCHPGQRAGIQLIILWIPASAGMTATLFLIPQRLNELSHKAVSFDQILFGTSQVALKLSE